MATPFGLISLACLLDSLDHILNYFLRITKDISTLYLHSSFKRLRGIKNVNLNLHCLINEILLQKRTEIGHTQLTH